MIIPIVSLGLIFSAFSFRSTGCPKDERTYTDSDGFKIEWTEYGPRPSARESRKTPGPTVFILPPTGGETPIERAYASALCARNQRVLVIKKWTGSDEESTDFDLHNRTFGRGNRALTIMAAQVEGPLRVIGTSLGGLYAISILQTSPRFERAVLVAAGWPFSEIITDSENSGMKGLREKRMANFKLKSKKEYRERLEDVFVWNKSELIDSVAGRTRILAVLATDDKQVPTSTQTELMSHFKPERKIEIENGHVGTIAKSFLFHSQEILDFLSSD